MKKLHFACSAISILGALLCGCFAADAPASAASVAASSEPPPPTSASSQAIPQESPSDPFQTGGLQPGEEYQVYWYAKRKTPAGSEPVSEHGLEMYESFGDIPYHDLEYTVDQNDILNRNSLTKDGKPWSAAPGSQEFGEAAISDENYLYIQCFVTRRGGYEIGEPEVILSPEEYTYRWLCIGYEWDLGGYCLPPLTDNKMIVQIDGDVFVFEDGLRFNTVTLQIENEAGDESEGASAG